MTMLSTTSTKTVASPNDAYDSMLPSWKRIKAICGGEKYAKDYDSIVSFSNLLIPFSSDMDQDQYNLLKAEAELPGICSQYVKILVGGLLRKRPKLALPKNVPAEAKEWLLNQFGQDSSTLSAFLDDVLYEELQTSRAWIQVTYPNIPEERRVNMTQEEVKSIKPYPIFWRGEHVINWHVTTDPYNGVSKLDRIHIRYYVEDFTNNEFHPQISERVDVHELVDGYYQIRRYKKNTASSVNKIQGQSDTNYSTNVDTSFILEDTVQDIMMQNERLNFIPLWPLNGSIEITEPIVLPLVDREVGLYNKIARRNHLLYGAATYTPVISSDMSEDDFNAIVGQGLGRWIQLQQGDSATVLETPTAALKDYKEAIAEDYESIAKLGVRMLSPETEQSGVALELRNAAQTSQLGTLNRKASETVRSVICFMIRWRYGIEIEETDIDFSLSEDFNPVPLGADWLRLATEWYEKRLIPRSAWISLLKHNDMLEPEYNDEEAQGEINSDELIPPPVTDMKLEG